MLSQRGDIMILTPEQLGRIGELSDQWSFLWGKRRSRWIAAEDCPDGERAGDGQAAGMQASWAWWIRSSASPSDQR